jgi:hypothetical protein
MNVHNEPPDVEKHLAPTLKYSCFVLDTATRGPSDPAACVAAPRGIRRSPSGNTNCLPTHWRTSRVVRRWPMSRQSVPAGPLARTDDPRASVATLRDPGSTNVVARSGFLLPRKPLPNQQKESLRPYIPPGAPTTRSPAKTIPHPYPSGAIEPCYVVLLLLQYFPAYESLLTSVLHLLPCVSLLAAVLLTAYCCASCISLLTSHCSLFHQSDLPTHTRGAGHGVQQDLWEKERPRVIAGLPAPR